MKIVSRLAALALVALGAAAMAWAQTSAEQAADTLALVPEAPAQVREGAILFDHHCSACHGDTGRGFAEAKAAFPPSDRACTRCHRPNNPPQMHPGAMTPRSAFDVGTPPPVLGEEATLDGFGQATALWGYLRATMPRPYPGSLEDDEYWAIVAFLAAAGGAPLPPEPLGPGNGADVRLR